MNQDLVCQKTKCPDYITDDGDPAWCNRAGCPAIAAVNKCPKVSGVKQIVPETNGKARSKE
jgi:hypothetical protein